MDNEHQNFVVCDVRETDTGWDIRLGPEDGDPWVSVSSEDFPIPPEIGDIATVRLPKVTCLVSPV